MRGFDQRHALITGLVLLLWSGLTPIAQAEPEPEPADTSETWVFGGKFGFDLPSGWSVGKGPGSQTVQLENASLKASIMISKLSDSTVKLKYGFPGVSHDDALRQTLEQGFGPMALAAAVESELEIRPVPGSEAPAHYFSVSDRGGRVTTAAVTYLAGTELSLLCGTADMEDVDQVLAIIASVRTTDSAE